MKYLTTAQFRAADTGLPEMASPAKMADATLARYINRAETLLDAYMDFDLKQGGGFEPHIIGVYTSTFDYDTRRSRFPLPAVPIRQVLRYRIQISNSSPSGAPLVATILPTDCVINEYGGYLEIVPLTAVTYAISPVIAQLGLTEPIAQIDLEAGYYIISLGETLQDYYAPGVTIDHKTFSAANGFWSTIYTLALHVQPNTLPPMPPIIRVNGVPQFIAALAAQNSGTYLALSAGTAYTSIPVAPIGASLPAGVTFPTLNSGSQLIISDGTGSTATTVTLAAPAHQGDTTLTIQSFTPSTNYNAGTVLASGFAVNYTEGQVIFSSVQTGNVINADYCYSIPYQVREAAIAQTEYLLAQRRLNQMGLNGLELVRNSQQQLRKHLRASGGNNSLDTEVIAPGAMRALANYKDIPFA